MHENNFKGHSSPHEQKPEPPVHIKNVHLSQHDEKHFTVHFDSRLTYRKYVHKTGAAGNHADQNALAT
jgi:hypothetical protein